MLIILSGIETVHKKNISRQIMSALNEFMVENYRVNYKHYVMQIFDENDQLVYESGGPSNASSVNTLIVDLDNDGVTDEAGQEILRQAMEVNHTLFNDTVRVNHFGDLFCDQLHDFGLTSEVKYENEHDISYLHPHTYQDIINNYNNRLVDNFVITGIFSKSFIDQVRADLGAENVLAINMLRNPSVSYLLNEKDADYYANPNKKRTPELDYDKLKSSILNCVSLMRFDDILTVRFEDYIENGKFTLLDKDILIPNPEGLDGCNPYNKWLTKWEMENVVPLGLVDAAALTTFNNEYLDFVQALKDTNFVDGANQELNLSLTEADLSKFPSNIFDALGYTPLSYSEITSNGQ